MGGPKRFLVVVRAGDRSLHPSWTQSLATRNWDLIVSYFGNDPHRYRGDGERRIDDKGPKWPGLFATLTRDQSWRDYDYIWLPDDDLAINESAINAYFELVASMQLPLTQPTLTWFSFFSHLVTLTHPSFRLRYTNFVEIMAPCFDRAFLERCLPTFAENQSGWGLGVLWPTMLPVPDRGCAMVDAIQLTHTRPVGGPNLAAVTATGTTPYAEFLALVTKYAIPPDISAITHAAVDKQGNLLTAHATYGGRTLDDLLQADVDAFLASRRQLTLGGVTLTQSQRQSRF